ncbi:hypothetical protein MKEN_00539400 [Mycena kentingensis (nom. inval.)]|nr:hypothetical protein MKEN_00539400 [Mycena kentingensis (nom. inval.)]
MASTGDGTLPPASDPGAVVFQVPAMDDTLGALLVGGLLATALWGVTCVQAASFFLSNSADRKWHKALVGFLWVLDTFDTVLDGHMLYHYLITNFFVPQAILFPVWCALFYELALAACLILSHWQERHRAQY